MFSFGCKYAAENFPVTGKKSSRDNEDFELGYKLKYFEVSVYINANIKSFLSYVAPPHESLASL